jgi:RNA polymerase sigma-70 factor, ECF subfamily
LTGIPANDMIFAVVAARSPEPNQNPETRTLGDLLYANQTKVRTSEEDWVRLVRDIGTGDQVALHTLYEQTHRVVFTLILRILNNRETAEELTLDVFHEVWRRAASYDPEGGSVIGWIMNLARSRAIDRSRFEQRKKRTNSSGENPLPRIEADDPHRRYDLEEQGSLLRTALEGLTQEERQVIESAFFSELSYREVAMKLNQPLGTVKTRIRSGLTKLRQALTRALKAV